MNIVTGFHPQFENPILADEKLSTIRKRRFGRQIRVGDVLRMFTGLRTRHCRHFADRTVTKIQNIYIAEAYIKVDHIRLDDDQLAALYAVDGFCCGDSFRAWFRGHYGLPFDGVVLHWGANNSITGAR